MNQATESLMFVATCGTCGRQARVNPAEVLTHQRTHPHMRVVALAIRPRRRDCRHRTARIDSVAHLRTQAFLRSFAQHWVLPQSTVGVQSLTHLHATVWADM